MMEEDKRGLNWNALKELSLSPGGFGDRRVELWVRLLDAHADGSSNSTHALPGESQAKQHKDESQIKLDTSRAFVLYPAGVDDDTRARLQSDLHELIVAVFRKRPHLSYFQGYHDIVSVLLLTLPPELRLKCAEKLSLQRVRDGMGSTLEPVVGLLKVLKRILLAVDPDFANFLEKNVPLPYFSLSHLITLFSHDVHSLPLIQQIFDYLLCRPPVTAVYLAASLVLSKKQMALDLEREGEPGMIHSALSGFPDVSEDQESSGSPPLMDHVILTRDGTVTSGVSDFESASVMQKRKPYSAPSDQTTDVSPSGFSSPGFPADLGVDMSQFASLTVELGSEETESVSHSDTTVELSILTENTEATFAVEQVTRTDTTKDHLVEVNPPNVYSTPTNYTKGGELEARTLEPTAESVSLRDSTPLVHQAVTFLRTLYPSRSPTPVSVASSTPRVSLGDLLRSADSLLASFPPTHPAIAMDTIMGPQSVVFTWSENAAGMPSDDEAERMVLRKDLLVLEEPAIVHPGPTSLGQHNLPTVDDQTKGKEPGRGKGHRRRRSRGSISLTGGPKTIVASAALVLGVAIAVYGSGESESGPWWISRMSKTTVTPYSSLLYCSDMPLHTMSPH